MNCINKQNGATGKEVISAKEKVTKEREILWRDFLIVLILAISIRIPFLLRSFGDPMHRQMEEDSYGYQTLANNLIDGRGFGRMRPVGPQGEEVWTPELCRTPGYPLLIAGFEWLTGHGRASTIIFQQILGVILCLMVMLICQRYFGRKAGIVAGCLLALDLQAIGLSNILLAESIFCFLLCCSVFLIIKSMKEDNVWLSLGAGLLLGISILTKPVAIGLPLLLFIATLIYACVKRCKHIVCPAVTICILAYLPVCAWIIRNGVTSGEYTLSSVGRSSLLQWSAAKTLARADGISMGVAAKRLAEIAGAPPARIRYGGLSSVQARKVQEVAISTMLENKPSFMKELAISSGNLLFGPEKNTLLALGLPHVAFGVQEDDSTDLSDISVISIVILTFEILILGFTYVMLITIFRKCVKLRRLPFLLLICLISALYILMLSALPPGCPRYRSAVIPLLVIVAVASLGMNRQAESSLKSE